MKVNTQRRLTINEQKALNKEIDRQLQVQAEKHGVNIDATVLLTLAEFYDFDKYKLREFWEHYNDIEKELAEHYRQTPLTLEGIREKEYYAVYNLKRIGVDVELWRKLKKEWSPERDEIWQKN